MSFFRPLLAAIAITLVCTTGRADNPRWTPPQQAFDACATAKPGDACSFKGREDRDIHGTCEVPREGGNALVCRPQHHQHHGDGGGDPAPH